jgi:hypothetical protein
VVARAGHRGVRLGARDAATCHWGALGGDSEVEGGGVDAASSFSCAEVEGKGMEVGKKIRAPAC